METIKKKELADALRDAIDSFEGLWKSEFEGTDGIPDHNNKEIIKAKATWNRYMLRKKK